MLKAGQNIKLDGVSFSIESKDGEQAYNVYCNEGAWRGVYDPTMHSLTPYKDDCGWMTKDQCRMKTRFNVKRDQ